MEFAICTVAAAPVRKEPSHRSEMVNQLLFGETMEVLETKEEWFRIRSSFDQYEGWLTNHLVDYLAPVYVQKANDYVTTGLLNPLTLPNELLNLPMGSSLTGFDEETRLLWDEQHKYHGTYRRTDLPADIDLLWRTVHAWQNAPYLWGGRTFLGVDCSGFVQVVYKVLGIPLLRDAYLQAEQGSAINQLEETKVGDLAFFSNKEGKIVHVGILMDEETIVHASGKVRVDTITKEGIIHRKSGEKTHNLHSIRRIW